MSAPTLQAIEDQYGGWMVWCRYCARMHNHGEGEGHRVAHCDSGAGSPYYDTGYVLRAPPPPEPHDLRIITVAELLDTELPPRTEPPDGRFFDLPAVIACDTCEGFADTVHLIPWATSIREVEFACPKHDPGGYWLPLDELNEGPPDFDGSGRPYTSRCHLHETKEPWPGHPHPAEAIDATLARLDSLEVDRADGSTITVATR